WAEGLAAALGATTTEPVAYLNIGERGLLTRQVHERQLERVVAFDPDLAVAACGGYDAMGPASGASVYEHELEQVVGALADAGALVVTFGLFDLSQTGFVPDAMRAGLQARLREQSEVAAAVCRRHRGVHVDFVHHPAAADPDIWSA